MLLQALYEFAKNTRARHGATIHDAPEFESRFVPWLIRITGDGDFQGFVPLMTAEEPGRLFDKLPRTIEPKDSGTIAEFLVEDAAAILGLGETPAKPMKDKARQKHEHFWRRIEAAVMDSGHAGLTSVMRWRKRFAAPEVIINPVFESYQKPGSRTAPRDQWLAVTATGEKLPLYFRPNTAIDATFSVDGEILVYDEDLLKWWSEWFGEWLHDRETTCLSARGGGRVCAVSGVPDAPISNSHLPKIRGRVLPSFGATLASAEADSVHSYGLSEQRAQIPGSRKGPDASYSNVSVRAAISYCLALNHLLQDEDLHIDLGPVSVCFWGKRKPETGGMFRRMLEQAYPSQVHEFLRAPFAGDMNREPLNRDCLYTVALSGNAGRVVIQHWLEQPLTDAIRNFAQWWSDLQIVPLSFEIKQITSPKGEATEGPPSPFAIPNLARVTLRESKKQKSDKLVGERIVQLYRAALEGTAPPIMLLSPILCEFHTALVKDDPNDNKKRTYPFCQSRFALIKLILIRNGELPKCSDGKDGSFMQLADTFDPAYNCGRLLAVLEALQNRSRVAGKARAELAKTDRPGAGVIERYYGRASTSPALVFAQLLNLSRHHLSKLHKGSDSDKKAATAFERRKMEILARLVPDANMPDAPPEFPRLLDLVRQGRFALGFYHQKAFDREQLLNYLETQGREGDDLADSEDETE